MMTYAKRILFAASLALVAACSGGQEADDPSPAVESESAQAESAESESAQAESAGEAPSDDQPDEQQATAEPPQEGEPPRDEPLVSPSPTSKAGEGSEEGDALCLRNCKGWELCAGEENLGPEFGLENCVEQCESTAKSVCGGDFEAFVDCALQQTCDRWMGSGGDRLEGCEQEFDTAMACMAGVSEPPTTEQ